MSQEIKDWMHYGSAIGMLISCVVLTFISFLTLHLVHSTVLMYVTLCITFASAVFGITLYFRSNLGQFGTEMKNDMRMRNFSHYTYDSYLGKTKSNSEINHIL